jgi:hypothetical protein
MSKFLCKCDNVIRISGPIPNPTEWKFISDVDYGDYKGKIDAEDLYERMESFLKCDKCGRLWVFWNGYENPPQLYMPEKY